jgi:hypothetical protein
MVFEMDINTAGRAVFRLFEALSKVKFGGPVL